MKKILFSKKNKSIFLQSKMSKYNNGLIASDKIKLLSGKSLFNIGEYDSYVYFIRKYCTKNEKKEDVMIMELLGIKKKKREE